MPPTPTNSSRLLWTCPVALGLALLGCGGNEGGAHPPVAQGEVQAAAESSTPYERALAHVRRVRAEREARAGSGASAAAPPSSVPAGSPLAPQVTAAPSADAPRPWFDNAPTWVEGEGGWTSDGGRSYLEVALDGQAFDRDGAVFEGLYIPGQIQVAADGVTFRDCMFDGLGEANYAVNSSRLDVADLRFEGCEFVRYRSAAVFGGNVTLVDCHIHEMNGDGLKPTENVLVEGCFIHGLGLGEGAHADGAQFVGGGPATFRRCHFWMPWPGAEDAPAGGYRSNATLFICTNNAPIIDVLVEGCWLNGGNYTVYNIDKGNGHGAPVGTRLRFNRIGRGHQYGTIQNDDPGLEAVGNVWDDTGAPWAPSGR